MTFRLVIDVNLEPERVPVMAEAGASLLIEPGRSRVRIPCLLV